MSVLSEISAKLQALGLGTVGANIFEGTFPAESPDACCALFESGGLAPTYGLGTAGPRHHTPAVQVVFRGGEQDYAGPREQARLAYLGLAAVQAEQLSGVFYHWIHPQQEPFELLRDDSKKRVYIAFNVLAEKELS